jgi:hypothetical protein
MNDVEKRIAALESKVAALEAQTQIRHTLSQYAIGVDEKRPELVREIFTPDAHFGVPAWDVDRTGIDDIIDFFETYWSRFDNPRRYYANEDITVTGDSATAFMYWHVTQERGGDCVLGWGTYDWGFRRVGDRWLIEKEIVHVRIMTTLAEGWSEQAEQMTL